MKPNILRKYVEASLFTVMLASASQTALALQSPPSSSGWPSNSAWKTITCASAISFDPTNDAGGAQNERDIVGDATYPAAYYYTSESYLFLRTRVEGSLVVNGGNGPLPQFGWAYGFDTNSSNSMYEWAWIVNGTAERLDLYRINSTTSETLIQSYTPTVNATAGWVRSIAATDSDFGGGSDDYFLDIAIPLQDFASLTAISSNQGSPPKAAFNPGRLVMWAATSANGTNLDKDFMCWDDNNGNPVLASIAPDPIGIGGYAAISSPTSGQTYNTRTPVISGTATPSSTFNISDGTTTATVTSDSAGDWTFNIPSGWGWTFNSSQTISVSKSGWTGDSKGLSVACASGYTPGAGGLACDDIDECANGTAGCDANATCSNSPGSFSCTCNAGYSGTGLNCVSLASTTVSITSPATSSTINTVTPTVSGTATANTTVTLAHGSSSTTFSSGNSGSWSFNVPSSWGLVFGATSVTFTASVPSGATSSTTVSIACSAGYQPDTTPTTCVDINECLVSNGGCDAHATCTNSAGSHSCACNAGYTGNGVTCTASGGGGSSQVVIASPATGGTIYTITPTVSGTGDPNTTFTLGDGTHTVTLTTGGSGNWTYNVPSSWNLRFGTSVTFQTSVTGGNSSTTTVSIACQGGYAADAGGVNCSDVDECALGTDGCDATTTCVNTSGTFACVERTDSLGPEFTSDADGDGVVDARDNCKFVRNADQAESVGSPGVGKACDFGDNNAAADKSVAGMKAAGGGCTAGSGNNGLGWITPGLLVFVGLRRFRRHQKTQR